jgi:hypothetical protein
LSTFVIIVEVHISLSLSLLGRKFYEEHGPPGSNAPTEEYMMMGILDLIRRPRGKYITHSGILNG